MSICALNEIRRSKPSKNKKTPQQLIRAPQQVVKDYVPMYKSPNATPISDNSMSTYFSQFKEVYEHFTKNDFSKKLKDKLIKVLQLKNTIMYM